MICEEQQIDVLLIAGDLFHRQPLKRELKELDYLFSRLSHTQVVIIAGNHDYLKTDSYYRTFQWAENVHMILSSQLSCVEIKEYSLAVYGLSYDRREIEEEAYADAFPQKRQKFEILLAHGGDEKHIPIKKEALLELGYDYIAMGHIHKPQQIYPGRIAYAGALEPTDKNDTGMHGYIYGELSEKGCRTKFVQAASREYIHMEIQVSEEMSGHALKEAVSRQIEEKGQENIYKITLTGFREPDTLFDLSQMDPFGNVIQMLDDTRPSYDFARLKAGNRENILGQFIESLEDSDKDSMEYQALCEGVHALMETRRG